MQDVLWEGRKEVVAPDTCITEQAANEEVRRRERIEQMMKTLYYRYDVVRALL